MHGRATKFLSLLILSAALSGLAAQEGNPGQRRAELPYRKSPHALGGHDRADLRREWALFWFNGKASPDYLDYKNQLAARETHAWGPTRRLPLAGALPAAQATGPAGVGGTWTNLGPFSQPTTSTSPDIDSGRPVAIVAHPTLPRLYLATSGGGVFRCDDADPASATDWTWASVTDALPTSSSGGNISVGALAMSPVDPNTLYLGAGDFFDAEGRGFFKTTDGGTTWTAAPVASLGSATRSYAILPLDANRILWATNSGLRISTDGGATFTGTTGGPATGQVWSLQKLTATELVCSVEDTTGSTSTGSIYYSSNAGATWTQATLPSLTFTPGRITVRTAGDGATAYAILEDTTNASTKVARGVLTSTNKGATWTWQPAPTMSGGLFQGTGNQMSSDGGQGWYNHGLAVDPNNPSRIFVGANLALYRSMDGGATWAQLTHWFGSGHVYAHADFHTTAWSPDGATLYVANDGGLSVVRDPFRAAIPTGSLTFPYTPSDVTFLDNRRNRGLASHMAYNVGSTTAASPSDSKWRISLGMQDNGTRLRQPNISGGTLTGIEGTFEDEIGGDGFGTLFHPTDGTQVLGSIYYTDIYKSTNGGYPNANGSTSFSESITGITEANNKDFAPFSPKLVPGDAARPSVVYTSTNGKVYQSTNFGSSWAPLGTTGLPAPLDSSSTGTTTNLFIRNFTASYGSASTLGIAANQSRVYLTSNGGSSWTKAASLPGSGSSLSCIEFDRTNPSTVYVGSVALSSTANHLWKSTNGGTSWTAIDTGTGFPFGIPVHVVKADPIDSQKVYVGTDFGVYVSADGGSTWSRFGSNLPLVAVRDLYLAPDGSFLRAATFGRGVWELQTATVSLSLDKATATVNPSSTTTFTATVTNYATDNKANWTVSAGGGSVNPTQTASGSATTYTAPATVGVYTLTASSNETPSATASATVNVYAPVAVLVSVSPATASLLPGGTLTFTATVANAPSGAVTWSTSGGTITSSGVYTAPATTGTYTITATSIWPGTTPGAATVTVKSLDLNGDGTVDLRDLLYFAKYYGSTNTACDFNGDGKVDDTDLSLLLAGL